MAKKTNNTSDFSKYVKAFWTLVLLGVLSIFGMLGLAAVGAFGKLPSFEEIENPKSNLASQIVTADGKLLGKFYLDNRLHTEYQDLSPYLVNALVATEDERYYEHSGIDFQSVARAIATAGGAGGGSTITQQLAKQLFHKPADNIWERIKQKCKEWVIAVQIERQYTKEEIIAMYYNTYDFIYQAVGINSAAAIYFGTTPDSLSIDQAAILVGMAKNPYYYNPVKFPENAKLRRNTVYAQMVRNNMLSQESFDSLKVQPIEVKFAKQGHLEGMAPYFREYLRGYMKNWIKEHPKSDGSEYNLYTDGLKIYTTLDSRMQKYAEEAVTEHMSNLQRVFFKKEKGRKLAPFHNVTSAEVEAIIDQAVRRTPRYRSLKRNGASTDSIEKAFNTPIPMRVFSWNGDIDTVMSPRDSIHYYKYFYQCGMMSVEPQTGFVKAWVGGIDYKHFKYDHVKQGKRQVGSTFKPFVYGTAMRQKHYSPCFEVPDILQCIEKGKYGILKDWCPKNSGGEYSGQMMTLKNALANSVNSVTTFLMGQVGPEPVIRMLHEMGVEDEIPVQPSIALGTVDLSVYDMVGSYTTFANKGVYTQPIMITRIEDKNGVVLDEFEPPTNEVMSEEDAYVILDLMKGVTSGGTGARLRSTYSNYPENVVTGHPYKFTNPIAGKTGTTQNNSDGWFMGVVPNLITGVWGGCEDRAAHFGSITYGQGATVSLPIWALYMQKCYNDKSLDVSQEDFERPAAPLSYELRCDEYIGEGDGDTPALDEGGIPDEFDT